MASRWNILYRGPLSSCNYACGYCPFAKTSNTAAELREDAAKLERFVAWVGEQRDRGIGVLFTPWGEALIHRSYQKALLELGRMGHVYRAAIQTNLSGRLDWLREADRDTVALWCTYHPGETDLEAFASRCHTLAGWGIRHSVGVVGLKAHREAIVRLRGRLPASTYLWVNAYKREPGYYSAEDAAFLTRIDPHFPVNNQRHASRGEPCRAGESSFTVDGDGVARRCHFIAAPLGNIHEPGFRERLAPRPCPNDTCGCHIGYVHLPRLGLDEVYGDGLLERLPVNSPG